MSERVQKGDVITIEGREGTFIATDARPAGGGTGHGPHDVYPDGWCVTAQRLFLGGAYDPEAPIIHFYQTGQLGSHCYATQAKAEIVGKMVQGWVPA